MTAGFLRDSANLALVVVGLVTGSFVPLQSTTSLDSTTSLFSQGLPA